VHPGIGGPLSFLPGIQKCTLRVLNYAVVVCWRLRGEIKVVVSMLKACIFLFLESISARWLNEEQPVVRHSESPCPCMLGQRLCRLHLPLWACVQPPASECKRA